MSAGILFNLLRRDTGFCPDPQPVQLEIIERGEICYLRQESDFQITQFRQSGERGEILNARVHIKLKVPEFFALCQCADVLDVILCDNQYFQIRHVTYEIHRRHDIVVAKVQVDNIDAVGERFAAFIIGQTEIADIRGENRLYIRAHTVSRAEADTPDHPDLREHRTDFHYSLFRQITGVQIQEACLLQARQGRNQSFGVIFDRNPSQVDILFVQCHRHTVEPEAVMETCFRGGIHHLCKCLPG